MLSLSLKGISIGLFSQIDAGPRILIAVLYVLAVFVETDWDNLWKSQGGIMVNEVPREVLRPKQEGPQP